LLKSIGTWKAYAISEVKGKTAWDILNFTVKGPVGGHIAPIEKTCLPTSQVGLYPFILPLLIIAILLAAFLLKKRKHTRAQVVLKV